MAAPAYARRSLARSRLAPARTQRRVSGLRYHEYYTGTVETVPDIVEFLVSDRYLDRPNIYPRQLTFLKVMFLQDDLFTQFDYDVIGEWEEKFLATGTEGISPGIFDRIRINKDQGRHWFRETDAVIGRRGGKGYKGGIAGAYVLWYYMNRPGGPQKYYGIDRDKRLTGIVFAGKKEQARDNQWADIKNVILGAPCFAPYISRPQNERLTVFAPADLIRQDRRDSLGIVADDDLATFEIIPAPSTTMAARGPASFMQFYDEMAHVINSTAHADAEAVYQSATPSLDQFKRDGFIYAPSSPWTKQGQFFTNWEQAIEMEPDGTPTYPERLMLQLPSWGPYEDWEDAPRLFLRPPPMKVIEMREEVTRRRKVNGKTKKVTEIEVREVKRPDLEKAEFFQPLKQAIQTYDEDMRKLERANPDTFAVERRSHWAESLDAYLNAAKVAEIFKPWDGEMLFIQQHGTLAQTYSGHGDPSNVNKRFGWSIGHRLWVPDPDAEKARRGDGYYHVVFDKISYWDPADFPDHTIDYDDVMDDIEADVKAFIPEDVSFDQFNVPATIGRLRKYVARADLPKNVQVHEVKRTKPINWRHFEMFKAAINMGWVHAPMFLPEADETGEGYKVNDASSEAENELKFLEEKNGVVSHPTSGPVQTKDIADTMCEVTVQLIGKQMASLLGFQLSELGISGSAEMGTDPDRHTRTAADEVGSRLSQALGNRGMSQVGASPSRGMRRR